MNDIERKNILEKFITLFKESGLKNREAAERLGIHVCYINSLSNERLHVKIGPKALNAMKDFIESGKKLKDYQCPKKSKNAKSDLEIEDKKSIVNLTDNEITRERLAGKLIDALEISGMTNIEVSRRLGISQDEIRYIKDDRMRNYCLPKTWEAINRFVISGKSLKEYHHLSPDIEVKTKETFIDSRERQRFILDIEINLSINGRRLEI